jgi:hypothetical protein
MTVGLIRKEYNKSAGEQVIVFFGNISALQIRVAYPVAETFDGL